MHIIQKVVKSGALLLSFYSSGHFCNILSLFIIVSIVVYPCLHCYLSLSPLLFPSPWRNVGATEWLFVLSSLSTTLLVFGLDSLDFLSPFGRTTISAHQRKDAYCSHCLLYSLPRYFFPPSRNRHITDT